MAGVCQNSYLVPEGLVPRLLSRINVAKDDDVPADEMIYPLGGCKDGLHPSISLWRRDTTTCRRIDIHWLIGQEDSIKDIDAFIGRLGTRTK